MEPHLAVFAIQSFSTQLPVTNTNIRIHKYKYWKQNNTAFQAFILIQDNIQLSLYRTILSCLQEKWNGQFYIVTTYPFAVLLPNFKNLQTDTHKTHSYVLSCPMSSISKLENPNFPPCECRESSIYCHLLASRGLRLYPNVQGVTWIFSRGIIGWMQINSWQEDEDDFLGN